jgi:hypothetical protein
MLVLVAISVFGTFADGLGRIVPFGLVAIVASVLWLTQIGAGTSYVATSIDLFVFGAGMGFTMMPTFSGAMQSIRGDAVARAGPALNIIQQTGASIGTAVLSDCGPGGAPAERRRLAQDRQVMADDDDRPAHHVDDRVGGQTPARAREDDRAGGDGAHEARLPTATRGSSTA